MLQILFILAKPQYLLAIIIVAVCAALWCISKGKKKRNQSVPGKSEALSQKHETKAPILVPDPEKEHAQECKVEAATETKSADEILCEKRMELLETMKAAQDETRYQPYAKLFNQIALPLQLLLGVAAAPVSRHSWLNEECAQDILEEGIVYEMKSTLRRMRASVKDGKIIIDLEEAEPWSASESYINRLTVEELDKKINLVKIQRKANQVFLKRKALVEDLGVVYEELLDLASKQHYQANRVHRVAERAQAVLECNGIYPLFQGAHELEGNETAWFGEVSENQLVYPGLFVREQGILRQLGDHSGTRRESE